MAPHKTTVGKSFEPGGQFHYLKGLAQDACNLTGLSCWGSLVRWTVVRNPRPRRRAGMCDIRARQIELHSAMYKLGRRQDLEDTFLHELAHAIDYLLFKGRGHGHTWKKVMAALGLDPARCHRIKYLDEDHEVRPAASRRKSEVDYLCEKCKFVWTRSRSLPRRRVYSHRNCGGLFRKV